MIELKRSNFKGHATLEIHVDGEVAFAAGSRKWQAIYDAFHAGLGNDIKKFIDDNSRPTATRMPDVNLLSDAERRALLAKLVSSDVSRGKAPRRVRSR